jgi:PAS domain S-box-containing protein
MIPRVAGSGLGPPGWTRAVQDLSLSLDRRARAVLPHGLVGMALAFGGLAAARGILPGQVDDPTLLLVHLGAAAALLLLWLVLRRRGVPDGRAQLVGTAVGAGTLLVLLYQIQVTGEPRETTFLLLLILVAGLFYLDIAWFSAFVAMVLGGWLLVAGSEVVLPEWAYFGTALLIATALAAVVLRVRILGVTRLEGFRREERLRQLELEAALEQTEHARKGEEEARKALEDALVQVKESEERFRRLADASFEGVVIYREGRIVDANARAAELFSVAVPQLMGDPVLNLVARPDRERSQGFLLREAAGQGSEAMEVEGRRSDGTRFPMELSVVDSTVQGRPARVLVIRDVTNQKRVEGVLRRALEEAEANSRAKSSFLANMSHELRTPLNSVIGFANILLKRMDDEASPRNLDYLKRIVANGQHLLALIEDILDLSKIDARRMELQVESVDVGEVVGEVVQTLEFQARKKGLALRSRLPGKLHPIRADRRRLKQVILNLVGNAIKFTQEGRVEVRVIGDDDGAPARLEVEDTGIGIPAEKVEEVFAPFQQVDASHTRAYGGTGLGLAISRSLCELMGFDLDVQTRLGEGSVFHIRFRPEEDPVEASAPLPKAGQDASASSPAAEGPPGPPTDGNSG